MSEITAYRENLAYLTEGIQGNLLELESHYFKTETRYSRLFEDTAELIRLSRNGPIYIQERASRLNNLLQKAKSETGYTKNRYHGLFRQINSIKSRLISDFYPSSHVVDDAISDEPFKSDNDSNNFFIYRLGSFLFGVIGNMTRHFKKIGIPKGKTILYNNNTLNSFPHYGKDNEFFPESDDPLDLLIFKNEKSAHIGLWCQQILQKNRAEEFHIPKRMQGLSIKHRFIRGRVKIGGKLIYLLSIED